VTPSHDSKSFFPPNRIFVWVWSPFSLRFMDWSFFSAHLPLPFEVFWYRPDPPSFLVSTGYVSLLLSSHTVSKPRSSPFLPDSAVPFPRIPRALILFFPPPPDFLSKSDLSLKAFYTGRAPLRSFLLGRPSTDQKPRLPWEGQHSPRRMPQARTPFPPRVGFIGTKDSR